MKFKNTPFVLSLIVIAIIGCFNNKSDTDRIKKMTEYDLSRQKSQIKERHNCDTISINEFIAKNYPVGCYLLKNDRKNKNDLPGYAVIYYYDYIFALITYSKEGEKTVDPKNIVGYSSSLKILDSAKLGTSLINLTLFKCDKGSLKKIWESIAPIHAGFSNLSMELWIERNIRYIKATFEDATIRGHRNFNYFFINGIENEPLLLETYEGIDMKRNLANINNDNFPDFYEYIYLKNKDKIVKLDSIAFVWKDGFFVSAKNPQIKRKY